MLWSFLSFLPVWAPCSKSCDSRDPLRKLFLGLISFCMSSSKFRVFGVLQPFLALEFGLSSIPKVLFLGASPVVELGLASSIEKILSDLFSDTSFRDFFTFSLASLPSMKLRAFSTLVAKVVLLFTGETWRGFSRTSITLVLGPLSLLDLPSFVSTPSPPFSLQHKERQRELANVNSNPQNPGTL